MNEPSPYDNAADRGFKCIQRMQDDLAKYAAQPGASQKAVDFRTEQINILVEFFNAAVQRIVDANWEQTKWQMHHSKLADDTQKLVIFCRLHNINPNLIFYYSHDELMLLWNQGARFTVPTKDLVYATEDPYKDQDYDLHPEQNHKYNVLKQFCK